jgi:hypothetical protein
VTVECSSIIAVEDQQAREEVLSMAADTFVQQRADWLDVRRRAQEAADPGERRRCQEVIRDQPPPSYDRCLQLAVEVRRKREVDFRSTLRRS